MHDPDPDRRQRIGLFRYGLIADLLPLPPGGKGLYERLAAKAALDYRIPGSHRTRVAAETLRDWLKAYRRGGFEALLPKERADRGQARALPAAVAEALLAAKEDNPRLSVQLVIREARKRPEVPADLPLPLSTVLPIPPKVDSHSSANWTPDPPQTGRLFQVKLDSRSEATLGVDAIYVLWVTSVNVGLRGHR